MQRIIPRTVTALSAESPQVVVAAHCTGWRAQLALAGGLPDAFVPQLRRQSVRAVSPVEPATTQPPGLTHV